MNYSHRPVANPIVVLREEFDDWAVLFNPDTAEAVGTNPTGVAVWKSIDGRKSLDEIIAEIRETFNEVPANVNEEIYEFLDQLSSKGFVTCEPPKEA